MEQKMQSDNSKLLMEIKESIARIEGKFELVNDRHINLEKRVSKLEEANTWLYRLIFSEVIIGILGFCFIKK